MSSHAASVRKRQLALICFGVALLLRFVVVPYFEQLPESIDQEATFTGEIKLFDVLPLEQRLFPIDAVYTVSGQRNNDNKFKVHETVRFNTLMTGQSSELRALVDYLLTQASIKNEYWERLKLVFGTEVREADFWVDARRATYITPEAAAGHQWMLPPGPAQKEDMDFWNAVTASGMTLRYQGTEKQSGVTLAVYEGEFGVYDLGSVDLELIKQRVRIDASGTLKVKVAADTGYPVSTELSTRLYAQVNVAQFDLLTIDFARADAEVGTALEKAWWMGFWRNLGKTWLPLIFGVIGMWSWFRPTGESRHGSSRPLRRPLLGRRRYP